MTRYQLVQRLQNCWLTGWMWPLYIHERNHDIITLALWDPKPPGYVRFLCRH